MASERTPITWVAVPLSQAEYLRLGREKALTPPGTIWAVLRQRMGLKHSPLSLSHPSTEHRLLHPDGHFVILPKEEADAATR